MSCLVLNSRRHSLTLLADAATQPQDRAHFRNRIQLDCHLVLQGGAAKRQDVGRGGNEGRGAEGRFDSSGWSNASGAVGPLCQPVPRSVVRNARCTNQSQAPWCGTPVRCERVRCGGESLAAPVVLVESRAGTSTRQCPLCQTSPVQNAVQVKHCTTQSRQPPNQRVELTPLRGPKIAAFLMAGIGSTACSIYKAAQLTRRPLGRTPSASMRKACTCDSLLQGGLPRHSNPSILLPTIHCRRSIAA
jgi:hypothetical protein